MTLHIKKLEAEESLENVEYTTTSIVEKSHRKKRLPERQVDERFGNH
jgi:hypothetical protein